MSCAKKSRLHNIHRADFEVVGTCGTCEVVNRLKIVDLGERVSHIMARKRQNIARTYRLHCDAHDVAEPRVLSQFLEVLHGASPQGVYCNDIVTPRQEQLDQMACYEACALFLSAIAP